MQASPYGVSSLNAKLLNSPYGCEQLLLKSLPWAFKLCSDDGFNKRDTAFQKKSASHHRSPRLLHFCMPLYCFGNPGLCTQPACAHRELDVYSTYICTDNYLRVCRKRGLSHSVPCALCYIELETAICYVASVANAGFSNKPCLKGAKRRASAGTKTIHEVKLYRTVQPVVTSLASRSYPNGGGM